MMSKDASAPRKVLPAVGPDFGAQGDEAADKESQAMKKVFVVDDDPDQAEIMVQALEEHERQVRAFSDPIRALTALANEEADLLIADLSMPWIDGKDVIRSARQRRPGLPIFLVSGYARGVEIAQEAGVRFFQKPLDWDALRDAVKLVVG
jgi:DNA-binding NtrC family response regulator